MQEKEIEKEEEIVDSKESDKKVYEVGYLLIPSLKEEEIPTIYGELKGMVLDLGGQIISDEMPTITTLAYTMQKVVQNVRQKYDSAYFGWVKFFVEGNKIQKLKKKLDLDPRFIRFLILKTVKENTIASKRFSQKDTSRRKIKIEEKENVKNETVVVNKEEIDKEIDAMVAN